MNLKCLTYLSVVPALVGMPFLSVSQVISDTCKSAIVADSTYEVAISSLLPTYRIEFQRREDCYRLYVFRDKEFAPVQAIQPTASTGWLFATKDIETSLPLFDIIDANFDGFNDLMLTVDADGQGESYEFYLFDSASGAFVYSDEFTRLVGYHTAVDTVNQCIETSGGTSNSNYYLETYEVWAGKPVLVELEKVTPYTINRVPQFNSKHAPLCIHTLERRIKGRLVLVKKVISSEDRVDEEWLKH
jgi:hypothetical protein